MLLLTQNQKIIFDTANVWMGVQKSTSTKKAKPYVIIAHAKDGKDIVVSSHETEEQAGNLMLLLAIVAKCESSWAVPETEEQIDRLLTLVANTEK